MEKTCGNCGHSAKRHNPPSNVGAPRKNDLVCLVHAVAVSSDKGSAPIPCGIYHQEPGNWMPKGDTLEQRYQQLVEVAREMYRAIAPLHKWCNEDTCCNLGDMGWPCDVCLQELRGELESLGVVLDA